MKAENDPGEEEAVAEEEATNLDDTNLRDDSIVDADDDADAAQDDLDDDDMARDFGDDDTGDNYIETDDEDLITDEPVPRRFSNKQPLPTPVSELTYEPFILPKWKNMCLNENVKKKPITLTDENASKYAGIASNVGWKGRIDYALDYIEQDTEVNTNLLTCLLESVVSTVITYACGRTPPDDYVVCSALYLQYIRNEFGENPPNIAAFLEFIRQKSADDTLTTLAAVRESSEDNLPPNVVITQLPKTLKQKFME